jgi:outer membrane lipoprotein-sorting protein
MKTLVRPAILPAAALALAMSVAPCAMAQSGGSGVSVHNKTTPSNPPAAAQPAPAPAAVPEPAAPAAAPAPAEQATQAPPPEEAKPATQAAAPAGPNALGAGAGWDAQFGTTPPQSSQFTGAPEQMAIIQKINDYFNTMKDIQGEFLQTDADDKRKKGKFYMERPGKVRFDYALPSKQKIISNGKYLAIEDHDLNTADRYPLESTPFRMLLKDKVDLANDADIIALDVGDKIVVVTLQDREGKTGGQIRLFMDWPNVQLREWIITDAQGLNTRIELANLEADKSIDPKLFTFSQDIGMPKFRGGTN